jgi:hypothetical protein
MSNQHTIGDCTDILEHPSAPQPAAPQPAAPEPAGAVAQRAESKPRQRTAADGIVASVMAGLFGATVVLWGYWFFVDRHAGVVDDTYPPIVVVDSDTLFQAKIQQIMMSGDPPSTGLAEQVRESLDEAFLIYTERGMTIAHKDALIAYPKAYDVTMRIAQALSIDEETIASVRDFQRTGQLPKDVLDRVAAGFPQPAPASQPRPEPTSPEQPQPPAIPDIDLPGVMMDNAE